MISELPQKPIQASIISLKLCLDPDVSNAPLSSDPFLTSDCGVCL